MRVLIVFAAALLLTGGQFIFARQGQATPEESKVPNGPYILQRGDTLEIRVFNVDELDTTVTIRPDGKISVMLLDDVEAAGMTTAHLDEILTGSYAAFYKDPRVTINVKSFANLKVYVGGEVFQPGLFVLVGDMTAVRAIMQAGGPKNTGRMDQIILLRDGGGGQPVTMKVNLKGIIEKGVQDIPLAPFDVVFVPKTNIAKVNQFVDQYIVKVLPITISAGFSYLFNNPFK
jgi:protein involved in polysaccharide export with SLBB domain